MKYVRLNNDNMVVEIIPNYALPIEKWYGEEFAKKCVEAPDDISYDMVYNVQTRKKTNFSKLSSRLRRNALTSSKTVSLRWQESSIIPKRLPRKGVDL